VEVSSIEIERLPPENPPVCDPECGGSATVRHHVDIVFALPSAARQRRHDRNPDLRGRLRRRSRRSEDAISTRPVEWRIGGNAER
jgi:hypothetical protein